MKKMTAILSLMLISSTVLAAGKKAAGPLKMEGYDCGLQVGQSISALAETSAKQDAITLSEDIANYIAQNKEAAKTRKKADKAQILQAANNSWQSIAFSMGNIKSVSEEQATLIDKTCDLGFSE